MNANILNSGEVLLIGGLIVLFAGILIGVASSGQRQITPTVIVERQPENTGGAGGLVALAIVLVVVIAALARTL